MIKKKKIRSPGSNFSHSVGRGRPTQFDDSNICHDCWRPGHWRGNFKCPVQQQKRATNNRNVGLLQQPAAGRGAGAPAGGATAVGGAAAQ